MDWKSIFKLTRESKILIVFLICISVVGFTIAYFYYDSVNRSEDPRVLETKFMFMRYDKLIAGKQYMAGMAVMDSIQQILEKTPGYNDSYELGIVYNNRASILLSMALYETTDSIEKARQLQIANCYIDTCITIYKEWLNVNGKLTKEQIAAKVKPCFPENDKAFEGKNYENILDKRVDDLILAQKETPRRLSVAYTNLGIIQRHLYMQEKAMISYQRAILLWKDNNTASSNLNVLMGLPPEDRSMIEKLFPPDKGL